MKLRPFWFVLAVPLIAFLPSLRNSFVWDDWRMVAQNPHLAADWTAGAAYYAHHAFFDLYEPLTTTLFSILAAAGYTATATPDTGHLNPALFHGVSLLLHATTTGLLFLLLRRITRHTAAAVAGSLLFALHPIQVEAVCFVCATNNTIVCLLLLCTIGVYAAWAARPSRRSLWWVATGLFLLSTVAKPSAAAVPFMIAWLDGVLLRRNWRATLAALWPWFGAAVACAAMAVYMQPAPTADRTPLWTRPLVAADTVTVQVAHLLWPFKLGIDYGRTPAWVLHSGTLWFTAAPAALMIAAALLLMRRQPLISAGLGLLLLPLLPNSGLIPFDQQTFSTVADRYFYVSMVGVAMLAAAGVSRLSTRTAAVLGVCLLGTLAWKTESQIRTWQNGQTLFHRALVVNPHSWMAAGNLSEVEPDPMVAIGFAHRAIDIQPTDASAWNNLGSLLMQTHQPGPALAAFGTAASLDPGNPTFASNYRHARARAPFTP